MPGLWVAVPLLPQDRVGLMRWTIVAFRHPDREKSVLYKQDLSDEALLGAVLKGIEAGANLFSIRGFREPQPAAEIVGAAFRVPVKPQTGTTIEVTT